MVVGGFDCPKTAVDWLGRWNKVVGSFLHLPVRHLLNAGVAKLADAPDLGSGAARHRGSSPLPGTS